MTLWEEIVDALGGVYGVHPGHRAAHAKGVVASGTFTASPQATGLCRAPHLQPGAVEVTARFSNGSGNPAGKDADRVDGKGLAVKFHLPNGEATDIVSLSIPVFMVRTPEDFLDFLQARIPDPETGEMDMERIGSFLAEHPETAAALQLILPALAPPRSYATVAYNSLHAFRFLDADGVGRFGRYRWIPEAGDQRLGEEEVDAAERDFLQEEIRERLAAGSVTFTLEVRLASEEDPVDDPTVVWPEERKTVTLGTLELTEAIEEPPSLVNDPMSLCDGIEPSGDRILAARPRAYSVSVERRFATGAPSS